MSYVLFSTPKIEELQIRELKNTFSKNFQVIDISGFSTQQDLACLIDLVKNAQVLFCLGTPHYADLTRCAQIIIDRGIDLILDNHAALMSRFVAIETLNDKLQGTLEKIIWHKWNGWTKGTETGKSNELACLCGWTRYNKH